MSLTGSSLLARIAMNPLCEVQVAMARSGDPEPVFYRRLTGEAYDREFGERVSARRRGTQFERNLFQNNAALLKEVMATFVELDASRIYVRNMDDELPGGTDGTRIARYRRTLQIIEDAIAGRSHPEIVIHPQLLLPVTGCKVRYLWIEPDLIAWNPLSMVFVPGDAKSFVVQDNEVSPGDLERTRLQIGAQILALRNAYGRYRKAESIATHGLFIFSTPYGLRPHSPRVECLDGPVHVVERALEAYARHIAKIDRLREADRAPMHAIVDELTPHFQEKCVSTCVLANTCRQRHANTATVLGDAAADLLGPDTNVTRVIELLAGSPPRDAREQKLAGELIAIADTLGLDRRVA